VAPRPASTSGSPAGSRLLRLHRPKPHATQARRSSHHRVSLLPRACVGPACAVRRWHAVRAPLWPGPPCVPSLASRLSVRAPTRCSPPIKGRPRGRTREYQALPRRHCCPSSSSLLHWLLEPTDHLGLLHRIHSSSRTCLLICVAPQFAEIWAMVAAQPRPHRQSSAEYICPDRALKSSLGEP
jgi:hypothetical protein